MRLPLAALPAEAAEELRAAFTHANPQHAKLKAMGYAAWKEKPLIRTWRADGDELSVPRGGMQRVREVLRKHNVAYSVTDERIDRHTVDIPEHRFQMRDYQERCVEALERRENCLLRSGTGSGKTEMALALIARVRRPTIVVVWSSGLLEQWRERVSKSLDIPRRDIGEVRGSRLELRPVTLAMQQTMWGLKREAWGAINGYFGMVVGDEIQRAAARTFVDVFDRMPARYRIGLSADERRKDGKEFLTHDLFGEVAAEIDHEELADAGHVLDVQVRVVPTAFRADWYRDAKQLGQMPDFNRLLDEMTADDARNALALDCIAAELERGEQALVFSHRVEHCRVIDRMRAAFNVQGGLLLGGDEWREEFERTVRGLRAGKLRVGVGTIGAIGQGIDLPSVGRGVVTTPLHSNRQLWGQVRGRMCRRSDGKRDAAVYVLWDQLVFGLQPLRNLARWNRDVVVRRSNGAWTEVNKYMEVWDGEATKGSGGRTDDWLV